MIAIEKNVPLPKTGSGARAKYPWKTMAVGDSFFVANVKPPRFSTTKSSAARSTGFTFTCRTVDGGTRVWRVA